MEYSIGSGARSKKKQTMKLTEPLELDLSANQGASEEEQFDYQLCEAQRFLGEMLTTGQFTDVTVICGGAVEIPAHKIVVSGRVPFFMEALRHDDTGKNTIQIPPEISPNIVKLVIDYAYFIQLKISLSNAQDLLEAAAFFRIEDLWTTCDRFITKRVFLEVTNCLPIYFYAIVRFANLLKCKTEEFIWKHFVEVSDTYAFKCLSQSEITSILSVDGVCGLPKEEQFWVALVEWIGADVDNRQSLMPKLLKLVRLPCISANAILKNVLTHPYIESQSSCRKMVHNVLLYKADPSNAETREKCKSEFTLQQRCKQIEHLYYINVCDERDRTFSNQIFVLQTQTPDGEWTEKCWNNFPVGYSNDFHQVVAVQHVIYFAGADNRELLSYNSATERWTVIQSDDDRPDELLFCLNGKLAACGYSWSRENQTVVLSCFNSVANSWQRTTLNWQKPGNPAGESFYNLVYCDVACGDSDNEMLCIFNQDEARPRVFLFNVQGYLVKCGERMPQRWSYYEDINIVSHKDKVFVAAPRSVHMYDVALDEWCTLPDLRYASNGGYNLIVANNRLHVISGIKRRKRSKEVEYMELTDGIGQWQNGPKLLEHTRFPYRSSFAIVCQYSP